MVMCGAPMCVQVTFVLVTVVLVTVVWGPFVQVRTNVRIAICPSRTNVQVHISSDEN